MFMLIPSVEQIFILIYSFAAGVVTGVLFDVYRVIRGFQNPNKIITYVEDILFWIFASIIIFLFLLKTNFAYLTFYCYLYIFLGLCVYIRILSKLNIKIMHVMISKILTIFRIVRNYILYPLNLLLNFKKKN